MAETPACPYHKDCDFCGQKTCGYCHACFGDCDMCDCFHDSSAHAVNCIYQDPRT